MEQLKRLFLALVAPRMCISNRVMKHKAKFFEETKVLFKGTLKLEADIVQTWEFTFDLQTDTEPPGSNMKIKYTKKEPYLKASHPIPPSAILQDDTGREWAAQVSY